LTLDYFNARRTLMIPATRALLVFFSLLVASSALAEELRPVTHEEVWLMKRLGTPVVSPDGNRAVVSVTEPSYEEDGSVSDLWLLDAAGDAAPLRLTSSPAGESDVDWSPDGTKIAFSAKREEAEPAQIYVLNMAGPGEAVRITDLSTGAGKPKWSPDGTRIAFESRIYPGAVDDAANQAEKEAREARGLNVSAYELFPVRQWDRWRDDLQTHLFVQDAQPGAQPQNLLVGSELVAAPGFSGVPALSADSLGAVWVPSGEALVINATTQLDRAAHSPVTYHLHLVPVDGGPVRALTSGEERSCHSPMFANDGKSLFCMVTPETSKMYNLDEVGRFDWADGDISGDIDIITAGFDRSVTAMTLSDNDRTVYVTAYDEGRARIFALPARGGEAEALDDDSSGVYAGPATADGGLLARWESSTTPAEIVRVNPRTGQHTALTTFNTERAAGLDRPEFLEFWFENDAGLNVHSWLALPPGFDENKKYPLVLMIHGGPFASSLDADHVRWSPHLLAAPGYVVLLTDYTGSVGYGAEFSQAIEGSPLKAPGDDVLRAADEAIKRYPFIDASRQAATGASYGGHLVNWLQATTTRFDTLVSHAVLVDQEGQYSTSDGNFHRERMAGGPPWGDSKVWTEENPASFAERFQTPILLTIGERDYRVPVNQTIAAWTYVQRNQVPGRLLVFHDANHWIMKGSEAKYYWEEVHAWLEKYLAE
jgi:dipeptidyl aminopeptidase/acylaminoacyl peptidase